MKRKAFLILALLLIPHVVRGQALIQTGVPVVSNSTLSVNNGIAFALSQARGQIITWQTSFSVAPTAITVQLQFSLDNSVWFAVDTSTLTTGELRYLGPISARFIRCAVTVLTIGAGSGFTCRINVLGFNSPAAFSGGVLTSRLLLADGTGAAPSLAFASSPTWGISKNSTWGIAFGIGAHQFAIDSLGPVLGSGASLRWAVDSLVNTSAYDIKLARTATKTITLDDGAGGITTLAVTGTIRSIGAGPTLSTCGDGALATGSNATSGRVNATTATACTLTFSATFGGNSADCFISNLIAVRGFVSAASSTAFTVSGLTAGDDFMYFCIGR